MPVDEDQGQADDDGGEGERDVDQRVEQPGAREAVAGQDDGDAHAEDGVERHGDERDEQREPQRVQGVRRRDGIPRRAESVLKGSVKHGAHGQQDEQGQVGEHGEAQGQAPAAGSGRRAHTLSGTSKRRRAQPMASSTTREMRTSTTETALAAGRLPPWERL